MPDRYWGALFAAIGLAFVSFGLGAMVIGLNKPHEDRYPGYRYASDKPLELDPSVGIQPGAAAFEYRRPCESPKGKDESNLCAQWRAAEAGEDSALWAKWSFWVTLGGAIGLLITILQGRAGLRRAGEANELARETAMRQLRAYITIPRAEIFYHDKYPGKIVLAAHFKNDGETPAIDVRARLFCSIFPGTVSDFAPSTRHTDTRDQSQLIIGKGEERNIQFFQESRHWGGQPNEIIEGNFSIYAHGYVIYKDIFGEEHITRYCYLISPKTREESTPTKHGQPAPIAARYGNDMTSGALRKHTTNDDSRHREG